MLITDTPEVARPASAARDKEKIAVLEKCFTVVADEQVRGRRVTVYERIRTDR
jgi:mannosyltransferase